MSVSRGELTRFILAGIGMSGLAVVAATAPGILFAIKPLIAENKNKRRSYYQAYTRLDKKGWIAARKKSDGTYRVFLTKHGKKAYQDYELGSKRIKIPKRWDGRWRFLIFDIPEREKRTRELIRKRLRSLGFYRLQDSVWVFPYECKDVLELLRTYYRVRFQAVYIRAEEVGNDSRLKKIFQLDKKFKK